LSFIKNEVIKLFSLFFKKISISLGILHSTYLN
jgi:hypothetical protein